MCTRNRFRAAPVGDAPAHISISGGTFVLFNFLSFRWIRRLRPSLHPSAMRVHDGLLWDEPDSFVILDQMYGPTGVNRPYMIATR